MGSLGHQWTIVGLGGLSCGMGGLWWIVAPMSSRHDAVVNAAPQIRVLPRATQSRPSFPASSSDQPIAPPTSHLSPIDRKIFNQLRRRAIAEDWTNLPIGTLTQRVGESFLGSEYQASLLDRVSLNTLENASQNISKKTSQTLLQNSPNNTSIQETLTASLQQFDCVLFVETALALAQTFHQPNLTDAQAETLFFNVLQQYRYRNGTLIDYCSRLHYFSDWILDHDRRGLVQEMGRSLRGLPLDRSLTFMSQNWKKYPVLVAHPEFRTCITETEAAIDTNKVFYLPTQQISQHYSKLQPGDVVGIVTRMKGLDVTHSGLVYQRLNTKGADAEGADAKGAARSSKTGLLHASVRSGIKISSDLATYVAGVDGAIGIVVARPLPLK